MCVCDTPVALPRARGGWHTSVGPEGVSWCLEWVMMQWVMQWVMMQRVMQWVMMQQVITVGDTMGDAVGDAVLVAETASPKSSCIITGSGSHVSIATVG